MYPLGAHGVRPGDERYLHRAALSGSDRRSAALQLVVVAGGSSSSWPNMRREEGGVVDGEEAPWRRVAPARWTEKTSTSNRKDALATAAAALRLHLRSLCRTAMGGGE